VPSDSVQRPRRRPRFFVVIAVTVAFRFGREFVDQVGIRRVGLWIVPLGFAAYLAIALSFRQFIRWKARRSGDPEFTPEIIRRQVAQAGFGPGFAETGGLFGSSVIVVNQRSKLLEVITEYELFNLHGESLATCRQFDMHWWHKAARVVTRIDQFLRYRFQLTDSTGVHLGYLERPPKLFRSTVRFWNADNQPIGSVRQDNIFGKKHFTIFDGAGYGVGEMTADGLSAWDVRVSFGGVEVAHLYKNWEGWLRNALTAADRYVMRIHQPLPPHMQHITIMCALTIDLALKQDSRGAN
jgi:hypothetical protein